MTVEEIKIRQLTNQFLVKPSTKRDVVACLCGVQAQFFSNAVHSVKIRTNDFDETTFADGLVRNWTIRATMHVLLEDDLALFKHNEQYKLLRPCDTLNGGAILNADRKKYFADLIISSIKQGVDEREAIKKLCFEAGMTLAESKSLFDPWGGVMRALCDAGLLSYKAQQLRAYKIVKPYTPMDAEEAELEIARRYFMNIAPATVKDASYFFKAPQTKIKELLSKLPVKSTQCNNKTYYFIENDKSYNFEIPPCILLAGFDQLLLGYEKTESLYLPSKHIRGIFNLAGIIMPAILLHGKVVGKWQKKGNKLNFTLFEHISAYEKKLISNTAKIIWGDKLSLNWL